MLAYYFENCTCKSLQMKRKRDGTFCDELKFLACSLIRMVTLDVTSPVVSGRLKHNFDKRWLLDKGFLKIC